LDERPKSREETPEVGDSNDDEIIAATLISMPTHDRFGNVNMTFTGGYPVVDCPPALKAQHQFTTTINLATHLPTT
jgi:hypothetical protein